MFKNLLIYVIIVLKIAFIFSSIRLKIYPLVHSDDAAIEIIKKRNTSFLEYAEILIYILILILFIPNKSRVIIEGHEKILIFTIGILGLLHTDWSKVIGLENPLLN